MLLALVAITFSAPIEAQSREEKPVNEQSLFGAEKETLDRPVKVPNGALEILRKDEQVLRYLNSERESTHELTTESFLASEIHLDGQEEIDLIVIGKGRLRGANVVTFWIFRKLREGYCLVLKTTATGLRVGRARWKGLRSISTASPIAGSSVEAFYRFDGKKYQQFRTKSEPIKQPDGYKKKYTNIFPPTSGPNV